MKTADLLGLALVVLLLSGWTNWRPFVSRGATLIDVSITSATAGTQLAAALDHRVIVSTLSTAAVAVWVVPLSGSCVTALTAPRGIRIAPGTGWLFAPEELQWTGQLCAILESGVTAVNLKGVAY